MSETRRFIVSLVLQYYRNCFSEKSTKLSSEKQMMNNNFDGTKQIYNIIFESQNTIASSILLCLLT